MEKQKLIYFITTYSQKIVLADSGEKDVEKEFYGYEFSNRRGHEGIHISKNAEGELNSKLYNPKFEDLEDPNKLNSYILRNYKKENKIEKEIEEIKISEDHPLKEHINYVRLSQLMSFDLKKFDRSINLNKRNNLTIETKWSLVRLSDILSTIESGSRPIGGIKERLKEGAINLGATQIGENGSLCLNTIPYVSVEFYNKVNQGTVIDKDILLCKDGARTGKVCMVDIKLLSQKEIMVNEHVFLLRANQSILLQSYLFYIMSSDIVQKQIRVLAYNKIAQPGLNQEHIKLIKFPLPPFEIQEKIVREIVEIEKQENEAKAKIIKTQVKINKLFEYKENTIKLGDILTLEYGKALPKRDRRKGDYPVYGSNGIDGYHSDYLIEAPAVIVGRKGSVGKVNWIEQNCTPIDTTFYVQVNSKYINLRYSFFVLKHLELDKLSGGVGVPGLNRNSIYTLKCNLPSLSEQHNIISQIEPFEKEIEEAKQFLTNSIELKQELLNKYL